MPSTVRWLRRFLANERVQVTTRWQPLPPLPLAGWPRRMTTLVFDATPCGAAGATRLFGLFRAKDWLCRARGNGGARTIVGTVIHHDG